MVLPAAAEAPSFDFDRGFDLRDVVASVQESAGEAQEAEFTEREADAKVLAASEDQIERRIVIFKKSVSRTRRMAVVRNTGGVPTKDLWIINGVAMVVPKVRTQSMEAKLLASQEVLRVEKDFIQNWLVQEEQPAEPTPAEPPPQSVPWGITRVNASAAWPVTRGAGVRVAVVDTGVDYNHPELTVVGGANTLEDGGDYLDDNGHGSHVAGTIAGADNDQGVVGVAPDVTLYAVKVLSAYGGGSFASVIGGIQWCVENNIDVANFSLGASQGTEALAEAVKAAADAGVAIIGAAGNSGRAVGFPAAYPEVLAVAASDSGDRVAYFSSRGPEVDVIAPGVAVESTYMNGGYKSLSGTSMACPHAAGLAALAVASQGIHGIDAVRSALVGAATPIGDAPPEQQGAGMIDAAKLVSKKTARVH